jgi:hypothetical protein
MGVRMMLGLESLKSTVPGFASPWANAKELAQKATSAARRTFLFIASLQVILYTGASMRMAE